MATSDIEKALTVFRGIDTRNEELATRYMHPEKYLQHNPRAADGVAGVKHYISQFPRDNHYLNVVRAFQDGPYVFTQEEGSILGQGHFFDLFRFADGLIVEHWVFAEKAAPANESGHTQTDGPTRANLAEDTQKSKSFIRDYYEKFHISGDHSDFQQYFSGEQCIRHEPGVRDGVAAFMRDVEAATKHRSIDEVKVVLGQGDFVFVAAKGSLETDPCVYIDLYRVAGGKIAEHWGFPEKVPPRAERRNNNGML